MTGTHATDWTGRIIMPFGICNAVRSRCVCTFIHFNVFNVNVYIAYRVCAFHECGFHLEHCTARKQNREREKKTAHKIYIRAQCWICVQKRRDTIILAMTLSLSLSLFITMTGHAKGSQFSLCFSFTFFSFLVYRPLSKYICLSEPLIWIDESLCIIA